MRICLIIVWILIGCSGRQDLDSPIRDRLSDYKNVMVEPEIIVPPELSAAKVNEALFIPRVEDGSFISFKDETILLRPQFADVENLFSNETRIYQNKDLAWVSFAFPPSTIWPALEQFIVKANIEIAKMYRSGTHWYIETEIINGLDSHSGSNIARHVDREFEAINLVFSLAPGLMSGKSELRVSSSLQELSSNSRKAILEEFYNFFEKSYADKKEFSQAVSAIDDIEHTRREVINNEDVLVISASADRVFPVLVDILSRSGSKIVGADADGYIIQVAYINKEKRARLSEKSAINKALATALGSSFEAFEIELDIIGDELVVIFIKPITNTNNDFAVKELQDLIFDNIF